MASTDIPRASSRVFAIPELLENMLVFTDTLHLFVLQSVNSTFDDTIKCSKEIRHKMCLGPTSEHHRLSAILAKVGSSSTTSPFYISSERCRAFTLVDVEVPCRWIQAQRDKDSAAVAITLAGSLQSGSWRQIELGGSSDEKVRARLSCETVAIQDLGLDAEVPTTLGQLVDAATKIIGEQGVSCEESCGGA